MLLILLLGLGIFHIVLSLCIQTLTNNKVAVLSSVSLSAIWSKLSFVETKISVVETHLRQQTRLLQTVLTALQSSGATDGLLELPDGIVLPAQSLQQLLDIEKLLDNEESVRKMVCNYAQLFHTHPFNGPFSGTTQVSRYQKG